MKIASQKEFHQTNFGQAAQQGQYVEFQSHKFVLSGDSKSSLSSSFSPFFSHISRSFDVCSVICTLFLSGNNSLIQLSL